MNLTLWILQGLVAVALFMAGLLKLASSREKLLANKMAWVEDFSSSQIKLIGFAEVLGAIGVIVPWVTGILPILTPIAAACLVVIMGGAVATHLRRKEPPIPAAPLALLALLVAIGRGWMLFR